MEPSDKELEALLNQLEAIARIETAMEVNWLTALAIHEAQADQ